MNRRTFLKTAGAVTALSALPACVARKPGDVAAVAKEPMDVAALNAAAAQPVLQVPQLKSPVKIKSIELLRNGKTYFLRTRSTEGATGYSITNGDVRDYYPILLRAVIPYFLKKDARKLDDLVDGVFRYGGNYKVQGQALWCPVAWVEFSILDLLGRMTHQPIDDLLGGIRKRKIGFYVASTNRHTTPRQEADLLKKIVNQTGARAVKFKVGGRMSNNKDSIPGRSEELIPLARKMLGDDIEIHADSNGSYDPPKAIDIGRRLEAINARFFEEPCPFDRLVDTKRVADALTMDVAGGECESSQRRFRWMIENGAVQVVQPDLHYYGGFIRATRVARMAARANMTITPHMSGGNTGYGEVLQFASYIPNIGPYMEYKGVKRKSARWSGKGDMEDSAKWYGAPLKRENGKITIPDGPGLGLKLDPKFIARAKPVTA